MSIYIPDHNFSQQYSLVESEKMFHSSHRSRDVQEQRISQKLKPVMNNSLMVKWSGKEAIAKNTSAIVMWLENDSQLHDSSDSDSISTQRDEIIQDKPLERTMSISHTNGAV